MTTIVTGFFNINREYWSCYNRSLESYLENAKTNLTLNYNMIIFIEKELEEFVKKHRSLDNTYIIVMEKEALPKYQLRDKIKGIMQSPEFKQGITCPTVPEMWNPDFIIIMWSKVDFLREAIKLNPFNSSHFCWLDFGLGDYANIHRFPTKIDDKVKILCRSIPQESDLNRVIMAKSHRNRFAGGFITGNKEYLSEFIVEVEKEFTRFLDLNVVDCDQTIYSNVYLQNKHLFELYYGDWNDIITGYTASRGVTNTYPSKKIYLKNTKFYFLTVDTNSLRKKHMIDIFKDYDITEINPVVGIGKCKSGSIGMGRMIDAGLRNQDRKLPFQPFIILEDDVSFYRTFPEYLEIPDDADILYIGISMCGAGKEISHNLFTSDVSPCIVRIYNMLSCHGIMICSASGASAFQRCMMEAHLTNGARDWDIYVANLQPHYNVYALKVPLVYQDSTYGGQEEETKFELNHTNCLLKSYNTDIASYKMCHIRKAIIIAFEKDVVLGGLGDRIIGLISCKLMANLLNYDFYILWNKENIRQYIDYSKYDYELTRKAGDMQIYNCIDNQKILKNYLMTSSDLFPSLLNKFYLNQEISQYLYKNKLFGNCDYYKDIITTYKQLYTNILIPTKELLQKIDKLTNNKREITGIQIRTGDIYMATNKNELHCVISDPSTIKDILLKIKSHCNAENVFITSDYPGILSIALTVWDQTQIIYEDSIIQHIDRNPVNADISKIFIDSYILSQKTSSLYISDYSNFGRIAALSCNHNNIFNLYTEKINLKDLLSKHEELSFNIYTNVSKYCE